VWKARDHESGEIVALKLLHRQFVADAEYVARFEREVEIAQRVDSPHVVRVLGFGRQDGVPYVAMEYIDGRSLKEAIRAGGPLAWDGEGRRVAIEITRGLAAAHTAGIVHRDVKPSNILLDQDRQVRLANFGIARAADFTRLTGNLTVFGTPACR
jgi:serine/threonine-protein kinase